MSEADRAWVWRELEGLLTAFADSGAAALAYAPAGTCRADELALDYANFVAVAVADAGNRLSPELRDGLLRVDRLFDAMSGVANAGLWSDRAVLDDPRWLEVRQAARSALAELR